MTSGVLPVPGPRGGAALVEVRRAARPLARRREDDALRGEWRRLGAEREASRARPRETPPWSPRLGWTPADAVAAYRAAVLGGLPRPVLDVLA